MNNSEYLIHYGVLGMKWGVRRYQNKDGSLTSAGKRRDNLRVKRDRKQASKNRRSLSDADLESRIKRLEREKRLKELTDADVRPGRSAAKKVLGSSGNKIAGTVLTGAALYGIKYAITGKFNPQDAAAYITPKPKNK